jgi:hypothetical protein
VSAWSERRRRGGRRVRTEKKGWKKPTALTLGDYADTWFERGKTQRAWKDKTVRGYGASIKRVKPMLGKLPISTVRPSHIAEYVAEESTTRVIRWRTNGGTVTEMVTGPMQLRTVQGGPTFLAGPTSTLVHSVTTPGGTHTVRGVGSTVTLPGETVTETTTQTVHDTVTQTVQNTVTATVAVTETLPAPTP